MKQQLFSVGGTLAIFLLIALCVIVQCADPVIYVPNQYTMTMNNYVKTKKFSTVVAADHVNGKFSHKLVTPQGFREQYFYFHSIDTFYTFSEIQQGKWQCVKRLHSGINNLAMDPLKSDIITG